jgi:hypothetical protein
MDRLLMSGIAPFHVPIDHFSAKALTLFNVFIATPPRVYSLLFTADLDPEP